MEFGKNGTISQKKTIKNYDERCGREGLVARLGHLKK